MAMNKSLQLHMIRKILEKNGIASDTIDLEAEIDGSLSLKENIELLSKKYGLKLSDDINTISMDDEFENQKNEELLEEYLRMNGIDEDGVEESRSVSESIEALEAELQIHKEQISEIFSEIVKTQDALETFSKYLFPEIVGEQYNNIRKAILLLLASQRDLKKRTRIHVLLVGAPGCGKTEILLWLRNKLGAYFVNAEYASKVGLAGDARGKEVTPGALAEADGSVMAIDELDKMSWRDQSALLQAMEEGQYTIIKGKHRERFRAEVRVVAAANDINAIQKPLIDRFDFVFQLRAPTKEERAENVDKLVDAFFGQMKVPSEDILREYLLWIRDFEPCVENVAKIKEVLKAYINLTNSDLSEKSYRSLELSILRIAYALAKVEKRNLTPMHVVKAIKLKDPNLSEAQLKYLSAIANGVI